MRIFLIVLLLFFSSAEAATVASTDYRFIDQSIVLKCYKFFCHCQSYIRCRAFVSIF